MSHAEYELVARVSKTRGLEGEVTATQAGDLPFCVYAGLQVHVVPPSLYGARELTVSSVVELSDTNYKLTFEGVNSIDAAQELIGRYLLADTRDLKLDALDMSPDVLGRVIFDERFGNLGEIVEVIHTAAHDVWVCSKDDSEVLIPVVDEVVIHIPDAQNEPIQTHIMDGLLEQ